jgi:hypothetical protein
MPKNFKFINFIRKNSEKNSKLKAKFCFFLFDGTVSCMLSFKKSIFSFLLLFQMLFIYIYLIVMIFLEFNLNLLLSWICKCINFFLNS